jgi:hypothetical protein
MDVSQSTMFKLYPKVITTKNMSSRFTTMSGRLTRPNEEELKICGQIGSYILKSLSWKERLNMC